MQNKISGELVDAPYDQSFHAGLPAGRTMDDTEQAINHEVILQLRTANPKLDFNCAGPRRSGIIA